MGEVGGDVCIVLCYVYSYYSIVDFYVVFMCSRFVAERVQLKLAK